MELLINDKSLKKIPVQNLKPSKWFFKKKDPELDFILQNSIKRYGLMRVVVVRQLEDMVWEVLDGHAVVRAAKEMNLEKVYCFDVGKVTDEQALSIILELNLIAYKQNLLKLVKAVSELNKTLSTEEIIKRMPLTAEDISEYTKLLNFDFKNFDEQKTENENFLFNMEGNDCERF